MFLKYGILRASELHTRIMETNLSLTDIERLQLEQH